MAPALPNLLVIGAPKCGTTSLHWYLDQHPQISMTRRKELHYFQLRRWEEKRGWYEQQFAGFDTPVRGEASPRYSRYPTWKDVPRRIFSVVPDARLIYMVRDPFDRTVSQWVEEVAWGDRKSFEQYMREWDQPDNRVLAPSRYATQMEQYLEHFPREQLLVIDQHDLKVDRSQTLREIFRFLDVDEEFDSPAFERELNTRSEKYALTRLGAPLWHRVVGPAVRRLPENVQEPVRRRAIRALSRKIVTPPAIDPEIRSHVESMLRDEADRLRAVTGKQFPSWSL